VSNPQGSTDKRDKPQVGMGGRGPGMMGHVEKAKDPRGALRRLLGYIGDQRKLLALVLVITIAGTLFSLTGPIIIGVAIDQYIIPGNWGGLLDVSLLLAGIYVLGSSLDFAANWIMATISQRSLKNLRRDLFEKTQTLSLSYFDKTPVGDVMSRLTNDVDAIGALLAQNVTDVVRSLLTLVGIIIVMFILNPWLAASSLLVFPVMVVFTALVGKRTRASFRNLQVKMGALNGVMQETITGQRIVIGFNQQNASVKSFGKVNLEVRALGIKAETYSMLVPPLVGILSNANIAIVAGVGSWMALQGLATVGIISVFITYSRKFADPLRQFANLYNSIQSALAGAERIFEVLDTAPETQDNPEAVAIKAFNGEVVFKDVDFGYVPGVKVLKDVSLKARPGQTIALVGPTGAGKTTIVSVLTRFYDIQNGSISIDGYDITEIRKDDLRRQLGIVLQDVFLFSGTVMDNIRYGRLDASDEECIGAAKLANADGFIKRLPNGYWTKVSERGSNLSQGQRQLLSIARAILANPSILVLDEATSSVDTRTEKQIQAALLRLMEGRTSFVIAHRLSTIRNADLVLVIDDGEIIERGTHLELLASRGFYYRLYMSQFKGTRVEHLY
jgi:ATP-binding cassette, subfamily B, multidrug efflux pump